MPLLALPSPVEWTLLRTGELRKIDRWDVIDHTGVESIMGAVLDRGLHNTERTLAVLELPTWHHTPRWWPRLLYLPAGKARFPTDMTFLKVYSHRFHCFLCGLDLDGLALQRDAYERDALSEAIKLAAPLFRGCPRCRSDLRNPGLLYVVGTAELAQ